jgi:Protein of unknown function (DUF455)
VARFSRLGLNQVRVCLSVCLSVCLFVRLSVCLSVCLSVRPSVRPSGTRGCLWSDLAPRGPALLLAFWSVPPVHLKRTLRVAAVQRFYADFARVADDEGRHFGWCLQRLRELGHDYGDVVAHDLLWEGAEASCGASVPCPCWQRRRAAAVRRVAATPITGSCVRLPVRDRVYPVRFSGGQWLICRDGAPKWIAAALDGVCLSVCACRCALALHPRNARLDGCCMVQSTRCLKTPVQ